MYNHSICNYESCWNHCYIFGAGKNEPKSKSKKGHKGSSPTNNWVHSPERNFEFTAEDVDHTVDAHEHGGSEPGPDLRKSPGIVFVRCVLHGDGAGLKNAPDR